ncbi:MAG: spinster family MFS transporter [Alphaproteobacteria bacterium]
MNQTTAPGGSPMGTGAFGSPTTGFGTSGYRTYVLVSLLVVYTFNFIDRVLIGVVAEPLIREFQLQDWQFGLLSGFGFALLYTILGIPIARAAETHNRVTIIAICVALWSAMTALCGLANSFLMLLVFRVGVGVGEAGCTPPANSLIADYFIPKARATALGVYAMGVTLGGVLANLFGGPIAQALSWREAFIYLGLPGILLAIVIKLTIKEPPRGFTDNAAPNGDGAAEAVTPTKPAHMAPRAKFGEALRELGSKASYWYMTVGATIAAFCGYGVSNFQSPYLQRNLGLTVGEAAVQFNVPIALASALGTVMLGFIVEKITPRHPNAIAWLPATGLIASVPLYYVGFNTEDPTLALVALAMAGLSKYGYLTAQYTIGQGVVGMRTRATAIAILLFIVNLIGYGLGPLFVGAVSDGAIDFFLSGTEYADTLNRFICKGDLSELEAAAADVCRVANGQGLRFAMTLITSFYAIAGIAFLLAGRNLQKDLVSR